MSPAMAITTETRNSEISETQIQKGVKHLYENGVKIIPKKYVLPAAERPAVYKEDPVLVKQNLSLPVIDFAELQGPNRSQVLRSLATACQQYGFFQVGLIFNSVLKNSSTNFSISVGR